MYLSPGNRRQKIENWLWVILLVNLVGLLNFSILHTDALATGRRNYDWTVPMLNEMSGVYSALILIPLLVLVWRKFPLNRQTLHWKLPFYLLVTMVVGALHTLLMWGSRECLYPIFGLGDFDFGNMKYRFMMELQKQVFWIWGTFAFLALARHLKRTQEAKVQAVRLNEQLAQAKLETLRQQLNPHFLFNTLNLISSTAYREPEVADKLITELSDLLRQSMELGKTPYVKLQAELVFIEHYLNIMKSRFPERFSIDYDVEDSCLEVRIPSFVLQPVVENSFKHRIEKEKGFTRLKLLCQRNADQLLIEFSDEGIEIPHAGKRAGSEISQGMGLKNVRQRLETSYGNQSSLEVHTINPREFSTRIRVPLQFDSEENKQ